MSTDAPEPGGKAALAALAAETKALVDDAATEEQEEQLHLLEPLTAEEAAEAQEDLGPCAGPMSVLRHAREKRKGRKPGSKNRRTDDTVNYLSQFGPDPGVALMRIIGESEDAMIARSRQLDPPKKRMSYAEARAMRIRAAETMMPYFHGKKPVSVDATVRGIMLVEEVGGHRDQAGVTIDGIVGVAMDDDSEDRGE
ncbi:hypothetical protein [Aurantiacibacter zhengii]|uniref:Uncharacterized protein n=1 Tax=Aurantiacibacter zhengii TaxID=2307003 RepID=A0A418NU09_9SPHN|nr:hypothetical protein [Aurantiacibacter zhengii]RIV87491.1 hypothetical protein D2V07_03835 [Aurantiacibacter zhengii]